MAPLTRRGFIGLLTAAAFVARKADAFTATFRHNSEVTVLRPPAVPELVPVIWCDRDGSVRVFEPRAEMWPGREYIIPYHAGRNTVVGGGTRSRYIDVTYVRRPDLEPYRYRGNGFAEATLGDRPHFSFDHGFDAMAPFHYECQVWVQVGGPDLPAISKETSRFHWWAKAF